MNSKTALPFEIAVCDNYPAGRELNQTFTVVAVLRGKMVITCDQTILDLSEGELFFLQPQDYFSVHMPDSTRTVVAFISFHYNFFLKNIPYAIGGLDLDKKNYSDEDYSEIFSRTLEFIDKYFNDTASPSLSGNLNAYDYVCFLQEHTAGRQKNPRPVSKKEQRIFHIKDFVERNYSATITLNDLASELRITPQYLATFIRQNLNMTFNQYLYKVRLSYAVRDLVHTSESITHIAFNYGFPNLAAFNRIFKEEYKKTPQSYRTQYQKNLAYLDILPSGIFDYEKSKATYLAYQKKHQVSRKYHTDVFLDPSLGSSLPHVWTRVLNVGYGKELNDFSFHEQLQSLLYHFPFEYGRIYGLFHPDMITYDENSRTWNFHKVDTVLNILNHFHLKPFIVLGKPEPVFNEQGQPVYSYSPSVFPDFAKAFRAFIKHCILRYNIENVEQWMFEYSYNMVEEGYFSKNQFYYNFLKNSAEAWKILKSFSPAIKFGGPGHRLAQADHTLLHILNCWQKEGICPDFITVNAYPMERVAREEHNFYHRYSPNPSIQRIRLLELRQHLQELYAREMPVYVIEMAHTFLNKKYLSDSRFSAVYAVYNMLSMFDLCECIALPSASDLHYLRLGFTGLLGGSNGLLTADGIKKPLFFALMFLHNLGPELLSQSVGHAATRHRDLSYRILLWNYKHLNNYFCSHPNDKITEQNFDRVFTDELPADFDLHLDALNPGKYFVIEYTLTKEYGSILDKWQECGRGKNLLPHIIEHLKQQMDIHFIYHIIQVKSDTVLHYSLEPHVLKMVTICPAD